MSDTILDARGPYAVQMAGGRALRYAHKRRYGTHTAKSPVFVPSTSGGRARTAHKTQGR
jgi:hypothetical protein